MYYRSRGAGIQFAVPRAGLRTSDLVFQNNVLALAVLTWELIVLLIKCCLYSMSVGCFPFSLVAYTSFLINACM